MTYFSGSGLGKAEMLTVNLEGRNYTLRGFEWTSDLPTQEGLYWAIDSGGDIRAEIVYNTRHFGLCVAWHEMDERIADLGHTHWLGPLPVPEGPKG